MTNATVAKLGDFMPKELKKKEREFDMVQPHWLKKLAHAADSHKLVAEKLGVTPSMISANLSAGQTRRITELAAEMIFKRDYANDGGGTPKLRQAIITAEPHVIKTVKDLIAGLGGQCFVLPEKAGEQ